MNIQSKDSLKRLFEPFAAVVDDLILDLMETGDLMLSTSGDKPTLYFLVSYEKDKSGNMLTKEFSLENALREEFDNHWSKATDTYSPEVRVMIDWLRDLAKKLDDEFGDKIEQ